MMTIVSVNGGWVIRWEEGRHVSYQGCDGYIAREVGNALPFGMKGDAAYAASNYQ